MAVQRDAGLNADTAQAYCPSWAWRSYGRCGSRPTSFRSPRRDGTIPSPLRWTCTRTHASSSPTPNFGEPHPAARNFEAQGYRPTCPAERFRSGPAMALALTAPASARRVLVCPPKTHEIKPGVPTFSLRSTRTASTPIKKTVPRASYPRADISMNRQIGCGARQGCRAIVKARSAKAW